MWVPGKSSSTSRPVKFTELKPGDHAEAWRASHPGSTYRLDARTGAIASDDAVAIAVALNKRFQPRPPRAASGVVVVAGYRLGRPPLRRLAGYAALIAALAIIALNFDAEAFVENKVDIAAAQSADATAPQQKVTLVYRVKEALRAVTTAVSPMALPADLREGPIATAGIRN
jgi:hypothetical protein